MEKELQTMAAAEEEKKKKHRGWKAMPYVIGNETFEKLGTIGTSSNLLVYLTSVFHLKSITAATMLNVFNGTTNLAPVLGAFVSDAFVGRYATLGFASVSSQLGMLILTLTAGIHHLHPPKCQPGHPCATATTFQLAVLLSGFLFMIIGAGGIRACNLAFGADQFDPKTESGKRGINSFFNWYFFTFTIAVMISSTFIIYVQTDVSWTLGLAIPAVLMFTSCIFFFAGTKIYVMVRPEGSPFTSIAQVVAAAVRKRRLVAPENPRRSLFNPPHKSLLNSKLPYSDQFRFLDKAAVKTPEDELNSDGAASDPWKLCSMQQVEEVKCLVRIIPVWSTVIIYFVPLVQNTTYVVLEALQSDRHFGKTSFQIPGASFSIFTMLASAIWLPIYDRILVPRLRTFTGREEGITILQRVGVGLVFGVAAMLVAGVVEQWRRSHPVIGKTSNGYGVSSMSALWLVPQLALLGLSEAFSSVGQLEFFYKEFPENMRSVAGSLLFCGMALANYVSGLMVVVVHRTTGGGGREDWLAGDLNYGRLDYFYFLIGFLGVLNFACFLAFAKWYRYKGTDPSSETELKEEVHV